MIKVILILTQTAPTDMVLDYDILTFAKYKYITGPVKLFKNKSNGGEKEFVKENSNDNNSILKSLDLRMLLLSSIPFRKLQIDNTVSKHHWSNDGTFVQIDELEKTSI